MNKNKKISLVVGGIIVLVAVFYGGVVYGKNQIPTRDQRVQAFSQNNAGSLRGTRTSGGSLGGFTAGRIIAKDANSITIELNTPTGSNSGTPTTTVTGSKIVLYTNSTTVSKTIVGTSGDLAVGTEVNVQGTANPDGSFSAQSVQIRPNIPATVVK